MTGGGTYVVTGSASGMGAAAAESLRAAGHTVIGVDLRDADVVADLSTTHGRQTAAAELVAKVDGRLDGAVFAAGMGPVPGRERMILEVNVLGVTELLTALRPALAAADKAKVVVFGSNSTTSTPLVPRGAVRRLINGDTAGAARQIGRRPKAVSAPIAYAASKTALTHWCRWQGTRPEWAGEGIRVNVIAPGPVLTPLLQSQLDSPEGKRVRSFPVPVREFGTPEQIASWVMLLLSPDADFMAGTIVTVDGGTEALLRTRDWPRPLPARSIWKLLWHMYRASKTGQVARY